MAAALAVTLALASSLVVSVSSRDQGGAPSARTPVAPAVACESLAGRTFADVRITAATRVAASGPVPAYCKVNGTEEGTAHDLEVRLPDAGMEPDFWALLLGAGAGLACGFLNTTASSGSAVSLPVLLMLGLDPIVANGTNRVPVLIGALAATADFHRRRLLPLEMAAKVSLPVTLGGVAGAGLAEWLPGRYLGILITVAVLAAFILLYTRLQQAIRAAESRSERYSLREFCVFLGIGRWLGFIVLDGATYLLLALTLVVGLPLVHANPVKSAALAPVNAIAMNSVLLLCPALWPTLDAS